MACSPRTDGSAARVIGAEGGREDLRRKTSHPYFIGILVSRNPSGAFDAFMYQDINMKNGCGDILNNSEIRQITPLVQVLICY
jgi:hypothetical protein